jgi:iron complex outermembrane receptor protein
MKGEENVCLVTRAAILCCTTVVFCIGASAVGAQSRLAASGSSAADSSGTSESPDVSGNDAGIPEVVVTANKREQSLDSVGLTVAVLSADQLAERQVTSLADVANLVPGLSLSMGPTNAPVLTLRGVGFYDRTLAAVPSVSLYLDEAPLPYAAMAAQTAFDLERIEVLKGPQGTLFGESSTGGALNYVAAKPTNQFATGGDVSYGRFNTVETNGYISGPLSDTVKARLAIHTLNGDDWQQDYTRSDSIGQHSATAARFLLDMQPLENLALQLDINGWRDTSDPQVPQIVAIAPTDPRVPPWPFESQPLPPADPRAADWSPTIRPESAKQLWSTTLRGDFSITHDLTLTSITGYTDYQQDMIPGGDGATLIVNDITGDQGYLRTFSQELRLANGSSDSLRWVLGGSYDRDKTFENSDVDYQDGSTASVGDFWKTGVRGSEDRNSYGAFGNLEFDVSPVITLKGGARYSDSKNNAVICAYDNQGGVVNSFFTNLGRLLSGDPNRPALGGSDCFAILASNGNYGGPPYHGTLDEHNVSWRGGIDYKPVADSLLYVNVSRGYKAGSYPIAPLGFERQFQPVVQEQLTDYEGGFKLAFLNRRLVVDGAVYYYDYRNKQVLAKIADPLFGAIDALVNIPKSDVKGTELEVTAAPVEGLTLNAQVLYTDAKVTQFQGINGAGQAGDFAGSEIPYVSLWQFAENVEYKFFTGRHWNPFLGASVTSRSGAVATIGADLPFNGVVAGTTHPFVMPEYTLVDLRAGVEMANGKYRLTFWGKNVFNRLYAVNQFLTYDVVNRYVGMPATYGVTFGFRFD